MEYWAGTDEVISFQRIYSVKKLSELFERETQPAESSDTKER